MSSVLSLLANSFHASKLEAEFTDLSYPGHAPSTDQLTRHVWNHHTQPVTGIHCGMGGSKARVVTISLDRTCKVHDSPTNMALVVGTVEFVIRDSFTWIHLQIEQSLLSYIGAFVYKPTLPCQTLPTSGCLEVKRV